MSSAPVKLRPMARGAEPSRAAPCRAAPLRAVPSFALSSRAVPSGALRSRALSGRRCQGPPEPGLPAPRPLPWLLPAPALPRGAPAARGGGTWAGGERGSRGFVFSVLGKRRTAGGAASRAAAGAAPGESSSCGEMGAMGAACWRRAGPCPGARAGSEEGERGKVPEPFPGGKIAPGSREQGAEGRSAAVHPREPKERELRKKTLICVPQPRNLCGGDGRAGTLLIPWHLVGCQLKSSLIPVL